MSNTKDISATPENPKQNVVEVTVAVTANDLTISDNAVARIQAVYDQFVKNHVTEDVPEDLLEDLKQETAVAVLEAMMGLSDDGVPNQGALYEVVKEYLVGWLNAQICKNCSDDHLSLQEIMQSMYHTADDEYRDIDDNGDGILRFEHSRKIINIYNTNGGTINIML